MPIEQQALLRFRAAGERARMDDLDTLLQSTMVGGIGERRVSLGDRIAHRLRWTDGLDSLPNGWDQWHAELLTADDLVDEVVAMLLTGLLRSAGLDRGTFRAAEALTREITSTAGVSGLVVGQTQELESINHTRRSVALRFPGCRVWDLVFLGHELGHHLVDNLTHLEPILADRRPLTDVVEAVAGTLSEGGLRTSRAAKHAHELMADVVATISCGPTYPIACLALRVPGDQGAAIPTDTHPSWIDRVATIRATLDELSAATGLARYRQQRADVVDPVALEVLGRVPTPGAGSELAAQRGVAAVIQHRPGLVYREADRAITVSECLTGGVTTLPPGTSVRAILDGAWRWRLTHPTADDAQIVRQVLDWSCPPTTQEGSE